MAELTAADVEAYTKGRLLASDGETGRGLNAALAAARRFCGWRVSPSASETLELDGPGGFVLDLPTLKLTTLTSVLENGTALNVATDLYVSKRRGQVQKVSGACWTSRFGGLEVVMTHGFTESEAPDFREAVLRAVDAASLLLGSGDLRRKRVDDVEYEWFTAIRQTLDLNLLYPFRIEPLA